MTLPVLPVVMPAALHGVDNGRVPQTLLSQVVLAGNRHGFMVDVAAQAFRDMSRRAADDLGVVLTATSNGDLYRSIESQTSLFLQRYSATALAGCPTKQWQGKTYWLRPKEATAATPGTSNHGWGLAIDLAEWNGHDAESLSAATLRWLSTTGVAMGWSAELQVEPWHWRWVAGDHAPAPPAPPVHPDPVHQGGTDMVLFVQLQGTDPVWLSSNTATLTWMQDQQALADHKTLLGLSPDTSVHVVSSKADLYKWGSPVGALPPGWTA